MQCIKIFENLKTLESWAEITTRAAEICEYLENEKHWPGWKALVGSYAQAIWESYQNIILIIISLLIIASIILYLDRTGEKRRWKRKMKKEEKNNK